MKYLVVGAGFSGAVIAEQLSRNPENKIIVVDSRNHTGGNCYTERDVETGVMVHKYGPHIFHTNKKEIWNYMQNFCEMMPFMNRVKSVYKGQVYSLPINLQTINQFFQKNLNPVEAEELISSLADHSIQEPRNFEEQALKFIGKDLYEAFFYGYTKKQWGCEPSDLSAGILKRLPVRFNYDDNYYTDTYQGMPKEGYSAIFERMLSAQNIEVLLNRKFDSNWNTDEFDHVFYSGPIDEFFEFKYGKLSYRTVYFERHTDVGDFQGNGVINYADYEIPYTRIHEHKHFAPWENHDKTIYFKEFSKETESDDSPYYPKRLKADMDKLKLYNQDAANLQKVSFVGRLGTYRYMDMKDVIEEALECVKKLIKT
ncbi:MAG: UDP-galactopyranose mutase [Paludibacteraceae bacterium]